MTKYIRNENGLVKMTDDEFNAYQEANKPAKTYADFRAEEYGSLVNQMEFITENGLEAWQQKVADIKIKYPKG